MFLRVAVCIHLSRDTLCFHSPVPQAQLADKEASLQLHTHQLVMLKLDVEAANSRARAAEAQAADLSKHLAEASSAARQEAGGLRERVLELEMQLDEQAERVEVRRGGVVLRLHG